MSNVSIYYHHAYYVKKSPFSSNERNIKYNIRHINALIRTGEGSRCKQSRKSIRPGMHVQPTKDKVQTPLSVRIKRGRHILLSWLIIIAKYKAACTLKRKGRGQIFFLEKNRIFIDRVHDEQQNPIKSK
jgi:hypothetical protein